VRQLYLVRLPVAAAIVKPEDRHLGGANGEGDGYTSFEAHDVEARPDVVTAVTAFRTEIEAPAIALGSLDIIQCDRAPRTLGNPSMVTIHRSAILRMPDEPSRCAGFAAFVRYLEAARRVAAR